MVSSAVKLDKRNHSVQGRVHMACQILVGVVTCCLPFCWRLGNTLDSAGVAEVMQTRRVSKHHVKLIGIGPKDG